MATMLNFPSFTKDDKIHNSLIEVLFKLGVISREENALARKGPNSLLRPGCYSYAVTAIPVLGKLEITEVNCADNN